ncbi:hypothetical protein G7085_09520 [Tessaracoccus sp. HDW20]|uniref:hypothetical protein n=1 Tax=Tessaracoccus coleopterorum TaxID=2714950 RepID=UPI0018D3C28C|nr:hypothetical protein [Tessaracoccus coleopterorum]NHB84770.1 hypothetical protein [Tessaracoccus coleopterorum]
MAELDERISRCLPALQLARVAGASPAEYLTRPSAGWSATGPSRSSSHTDTHGSSEK